MLGVKLPFYNICLKLLVDLLLFHYIRRKLKQYVQEQFGSLSQDDISKLLPNKEEMTVMKILTHGETLVTCYCLKKNPILFEIEGVLYPTGKY